MKYPGMVFAVLLSCQAYAVPVIPIQQNLYAVEYSSAGGQTGCGLRITGVVGESLSLNVLITVFVKETGMTFGVIKVVARSTNMNGLSAPQDDAASNLAGIHRAWIESDSGIQPQIYQDGKSLHNDAYMVSAEFASTVNLLVAVSGENFRVGLSRNEGGPDEVFQFDQRINQEEAGKLSVCMKNLRSAIAENKRSNTF